MASKGVTTSLLETTFSESPKVDRDNKVIRNVKILGKVSRNGYEYSDSALEEAARLYEGVTVNVNHPPRSAPNTERAFQDGIGIIRAPKRQPDGVFGDLHYYESHPHAGLMVERAEREPHSFGLSHNADGRKVNFRGKTIVESVTRVRSVDLVGRPATTKGIFESEDSVKTTIKALLETVKDKSHKGYKALVEMVGEEPAMGETPMDELPVDASTDDQVKSAFRAMVVAAFDDEKLDSKATLAKIKDILAAQEKLMGGGEKKEPKPEETSESLKDKADPTTKALLEEVRQLRAEREAEKQEKSARALLESMDREATQVRLTALTAVPESARKSLVESWPKRQVANGKPQRTVPLTESEAPGEYKPPASAKEWAAAIR